jgi:hypothetical protein
LHALQNVNIIADREVRDKAARDRDLRLQDIDIRVRDMDLRVRASLANTAQSTVTATVTVTSTSTSIVDPTAPATVNTGIHVVANEGVSPGLSVYDDAAAWEEYNRNKEEYNRKKREEARTKKARARNATAVSALVVANDIVSPGLIVYKLKID